MAPVHISSTGQFEKLLTSTRVVIVDFYADWCGPCKAIAPVFESLCAAESKPGQVAFCKVDVDSQQGIAQKYGVTAMPTFITFVRGSQSETIRGANPGALRSAVKKAIAAAGAGGSASFESKGRVLGTGSSTGGGSGSSGSGSSGSSWGSAAGGGQGFDVASMIPGGLLGTVTRFVGLYFTTLLTFDPKDVAETSPFRSGAQQVPRRRW